MSHAAHARTQPVFQAWSRAELTSLLQPYFDRPQPSPPSRAPLEPLTRTAQQHLLHFVVLAYAALLPADPKTPHPWRAALVHLHQHADALVQPRACDALIGAYFVAYRALNAQHDHPLLRLLLESINVLRACVDESVRIVYAALASASADTPPLPESAAERRAGVLSFAGPGPKALARVRDSIFDACYSREHACMCAHYDQLAAEAGGGGSAVCSTTFKLTLALVVLLAANVALYLNSSASSGVSAFSDFTDGAVLALRAYVDADALSSPWMPACVAMTIVICGVALCRRSPCAIPAVDTTRPGGSELQ